MIISVAKVLADVTRTGKDRRAIFVQFAAADISAQLDLLQQQQLYQFGQLRSIFIDTASQPAGSNGCRIETDSGQTIVAAPGTQGYYTVFVPFVSKLIISSNAGVNLILFDRDVAPQVWSSQANSGSIPNPLPVQIDGQPIATYAAIQNWPPVQPVSNFAAQAQMRRALLTDTSQVPFAVPPESNLYFGSIFYFSDVTCGITSVNLNDAENNLLAVIFLGGVTNFTGIFPVSIPVPFEMATGIPTATLFQALTNGFVVVHGIFGVH